MLEKLKAVEQRYRELQDLLNKKEIFNDIARLGAISKEKASLDEVITLNREYEKLLLEVDATEALLQETDDQIQALAKDELRRLIERRDGLESKLRLALIPKDKDDQRDVIVEIRSGAGGEEAALFATELYRAYSRYALNQRWKVDVLNSSPTGLGGLKEIIFEIKGSGVFSKMKYERGVHRVQRVPVTESSGRIHTSTSTVAVLPEPEEIEVSLNQSELRIDVYHASGHGGQSVQKVATAIRVTHIPTGIVAICQDERSQVQNKRKALQVLRARLYESETKKQEAAITESRRSQIGGAERSEKIRTYNYPQNRVTDHRSGKTFYNLVEILDGNLEQLIEVSASYEQAKKLEESGLDIAGDKS